MTEETKPETRTQLEKEQRFSQSLLWQLQRNFFNRQGVDAWRNGIVPHYITSNPYLAQVYAQLVFAWLRDLTALPKSGETPSLDISQPVYLVELGAGSGRFAYHFLKKFFGFFDQSVLKDIPVKYVMTDFSQRTLDFWQEHPQLQPFVEAGRLDFARFDAEQDQSLPLVHSGETLEAGSLKNPLGIIANYFFDGLRQDLFHIEEGQLHESLVSLTTSQTKPDLNDPELLDQVNVSYTDQPIKGNYYDEPAFNQMLDDYRQSLVKTYLLFPIGSLQCLHTLCRLANGRMILISGDKGYHRQTDLLFRGEPGITIHGGSFSMMINYHALGQYFLNQGGQFLNVPHRHANLDICLFLLDQQPQPYPETRQAYELTVVQGGPDDFFTLKKGVEEHYQHFDLTQLLAYLRLSGWDHHIFVLCFPVLMEQLKEATPILREELYWAAQQVWQTYYTLGEELDVPFMLGMILYGLEYYPEAIEYLQYSLRLYGPDSATLYNLGMCHYELRLLEPALDFINQTLDVDATFEPARAMRLKLQEELSRRR